MRADKIRYDKTKQFYLCQITQRVVSQSPEPEAHDKGSYLYHKRNSNRVYCSLKRTRMGVSRFFGSTDLALISARLWIFAGSKHLKKSRKFKSSVLPVRHWLFLEQLTLSLFKICFADVACVTTSQQIHKFLECLRRIINVALQR